MHADDIAGPGIINMTAVLRHEGQGVGYLDILVQTHMPDFHALRETAGTDTHKCDPVAVGGIHIGLDLKDKTGQCRLIAGHLTADARPGFGCRRMFDEGIK